MTDLVSNLGPVAKSIYETREFHYGRMEQLPQPLRVLLQVAPYKYAVGPFYDWYMRERTSRTVEELAREWARKMARDRRRAVLTLYGPNHPQARA